MLRDPTPSERRLMQLGQATDAYLRAAGVPTTPAPWPEPTPEQVEKAKQAQAPFDARRVQ